VRKFEERLRREVVERDEAGRESPGLTKVMSVVDALDTLSPGVTLDNQSLAVALQLARTGMPLLDALHGRDPEAGNRQYLRVMLRARERQPADSKQRLIEQVRGLAREEFGDEVQVTGFFVLLTRLIESVSRDQWLTFGVATAGIWIMMLVAFRSFKLALITLAPNALPILVVTGMMGWLGLRINMGAAMIASVSMGLSVDSSIHYLTDYNRQRALGLSLHEALAAVHQKVGRAMIFSTLALVVGFSVLCLSEFVPTIYFGVLVSLAMLGGMAGNLVILPLLLKLVSRDK
jgi:predicted RND superfamily exporter protein